MCGIAGLITHNSCHFEGAELAEIGKDMLAQIRHRGPDESGIYFNENTVTGTVRLSIIDIQNGQQPMMHQNRYVLNYNGEVFNYIELRTELENEGMTFSTSSDTEVVLKSLICWGTDALSKFDGHFAISFFDTEEKKLLLARDPFGEKPLFYTKNDNFFAFGSEIKTFRAIPNFAIKLQQERLSHSAWFWTNLPNQSVFENIDSVRPGHFIIQQGNNLTQHQYYNLPQLNTTGKSQADYEEAQEQLKELMKESIRKRLRSDVEVASYLSGGLDSTIVTCLAKDLLGHKLKTFSVTFSDEGYDESEFQNTVAEHLKTEHHTVRVSHSDIVENFSSTVEHAETALFRTALTPMLLLSKQVEQQNIKVVLTGEGADELFCGYDIFKETIFRENYNNFSNDEERIETILNLYPYLPHFEKEKAQQLLQYFKNYTNTDSNFFSHDLRFSNGMLASQLLTNSQNRDTSEKNLLSELSLISNGNFDKHSKLEQAQITEIKTLMEGYLLSSQGDRMTSANSIEGRCPFLCQSIVEFAQSIPLEMKLKDGFEKKILRDSFAENIPSSNMLRRKQPYRAPDAAPFLSNEEYINDYVIDNLLNNTDNIKKDIGLRFINKLQNKPASNISPREDQAFILMLSTLMLEQEFCAKKATPFQAHLNLKVEINDTKH